MGKNHRAEQNASTCLRTNGSLTCFSQVNLPHKMLTPLLRISKCCLFPPLHTVRKTAREWCANPKKSAFYTNHSKLRSAGFDLRGSSFGGFFAWQETQKNYMGRAHVPKDSCMHAGFFPSKELTLLFCYVFGK